MSLLRIPSSGLMFGGFRLVARRAQTPTVFGIVRVQAPRNQSLSGGGVVVGIFRWSLHAQDAYRITSENFFTEPAVATACVPAPSRRAPVFFSCLLMLVASTTTTEGLDQLGATRLSARLLGCNGQPDHLTASGYDEAPNHCCDSGLSLEPVRPFNQ